MIDGRIDDEGWPLVGASTMRALDRHTIDVLGVPGALLMESAGRAVAEATLQLRASERGVVVVCGVGNNGGDGLVAARHLALLGVRVSVAIVGDIDRLTPDAAANLDRLRAMGIAPVTTRGESASVPFDLPATAGVVIDAIFGTGLSRAPEGIARAAIDKLRSLHGTATIVSVDLPSGVDADTGQPHGVAVAADVTVTVGLPKLGLVLEPGRSLAGRVLVARVGIADAGPHVAPDAVLPIDASVARRLPPRPRDGHKGRFGHVLLLAGGRGKAGAAALAARGALRGGAGLVTVACSRSTSDVLQTSLIEAMTVPFPDVPSGGIGVAEANAILALARDRDVFALGPGLGTAPETAALILRLVAGFEGPLVLDADALQALAGRPDVLKRRGAVSMLTPHPGEAARFLGITPTEVNRDRVGAARRLAEITASVVLLKGAATVVATPDARLAVIAAGGPVLGAGGTGDVLTGLVAALLAQGVGPFDAAVAAAHVHGRAGDACAAMRGDAGTLAHEIADAIPAAMQRLREQVGARHPGALSSAMHSEDGERVDDSAERTHRDDERRDSRCRHGLLVPLPIP